MPAMPFMSRARRSTGRVVTVTALLLTASMALAACGGDQPTSEPADSPTAQGTAEGTTLMGQWPLTGLPAQGEAPKHPVIVVKIDNTGASTPQIGLGSADLVAEELVEGGSTRLAVFYHSQIPDRVGPVRSMRSTDIGIVKPADAVLVASGGAPATVRRVRSAGIEVIGEGGPGYARDSSRTSPYNLFMELPVLVRTLSSPAPPEPPESYFTWGDEDSFPAGRRARSLAATFSGGQTTNWQYRKGKYVNLNSRAATGDEFRADTVLVLRVQVGDAGYKDPAGNPVPETRFSGSGKALVFHAGSVVPATWRKSGLDAPVTLRTKTGELEVPPGKVWLELVPTNGGNVTYGR